MVLFVQHFAVLGQVASSDLAKNSNYETLMSILSLLSVFNLEVRAAQPGVLPFSLTPLLLVFSSQ